MKKSLNKLSTLRFSLIVLFANISMCKAVVAQPIPISVLTFKDKTAYSSCRYGWDNYWGRYLGEGFKDILISELKKSDKIALFERDNIRKIYNEEHELVNSEEDTKIAKKKFKKAKYTFVGAVTEFEYCADTSGAKVNVASVAGFFGVPAPNINIGKKGAKAKLAIDVRVIDVTTGEVVKTITTEGEAEDSKFTFDSDAIDYKNESNSPMGKAARAAIAKAAVELINAVN